jgi:hypothetical protein
LKTFPYFDSADAIPEVSCGEDDPIDTEYSETELLADDDDDEDLDATPEDVIEILGFDPFPESGN